MFITVRLISLKSNFFGASLENNIGLSLSLYSLLSLRRSLYISNMHTKYICKFKVPIGIFWRQFIVHYVERYFSVLSKFELIIRVVRPYIALISWLCRAKIYYSKIIVIYLRLIERYLVLFTAYTVFITYRSIGERRLNIQYFSL